MVLLQSNVRSVLADLVGFESNTGSLLLVTANPETIDDNDFGLDNINSNRKDYEKLFKDKRKHLIATKATGIELYEYPSHFALLDTNNKEVLYYMQYLKHKVFKVPSITQLKVWASAYTTNTDNFEGDTLTTYIFFKHLLPKAGMIVTDKMQTSAGKRFWEKRITQAFASGLNVYGLDQNQNAVKKFTSLKEWRDYAEYFYGEAHKHQGRKIGISKNNYPEKNTSVFIKRL